MTLGHDHRSRSSACECPLYVLAVDANNVLWHMATKTGIEPVFHCDQHAQRVMEMVRERQEVTRAGDDHG